MRTLHCVAGFGAEMTGALYAPVALCNALVKEGHSAEIVGLGNADSPVADCVVQSPNIVFHRIPAIGSKRIGYSKNLLPWLRANLSRFDLVILHCIWRSFSLILAREARRHSIPYIIYPHGSLLYTDLKKRRLAKILLGRLLIGRLIKNCAAIVYASTFERENSHTYGGVPQQFIAAMVVERFSVLGSRKRFRENFSITPDARVLLFLGRLDPQKGIDKLVGAMREISHLRNDYVLLVAGGGNSSFAIQARQRISELGLSARYLGIVGEEMKADALAAADALVSPSRYESFGLVVVEALSAGLPVFLSETHPLLAQVVKIGAGFCCGSNARSISTSLLEVFEGGEKLESARLIAPQAAEQLFSNEKIIEDHLMIYSKIALERGHVLSLNRS